MTAVTARYGTALLTLCALIAFAANSVLCRMALGVDLIDAASFTAIRLSTGAFILWLLLSLFLRPPVPGSRGSWVSASMLFLYALSFSFAYRSLSAGTGALILFGCVQATMILSGLWTGERPDIRQWSGLVIALCGLVYLVSPGLAAPPPLGSVLMAVAGVGWGIYSLRGRGAADPVLTTTYNFLRAVPFAAVVLLPMVPRLHVSPRGFFLASLSGVLASGIGYVIWYAALRGLSATRAATVQLSVPVLTAFGGAMFLSERVSARLVIASLLILGGVGLTVIGRERKVRAAGNRH